MAKDMDKKGIIRKQAARLRKGEKFIEKKGRRVIKKGGKALIKSEKRLIKGIKKGGKHIKKGGKAINKKRVTYQKKVAKNIGIIFILLMIIIFIIVLINYKHFEDEAEYFAQTYGSAGIFVVSIAIDMTVQPIGPDIPLIGGILGGVNKYYALIAAALGSIVASLIGYLLGFYYGEYGIKKIYGETKYRKWEKFYTRWGRWGLAIAAMSPVPYVPFCWISGIFKMKIWHFMIFAFIPRTIRFIVVMYLAGIVVGV